MMSSNCVLVTLPFEIIDLSINFISMYCLQNDPKAHDNFLKITRAYEVLKVWHLIP